MNLFAVTVEKHGDWFVLMVSRCGMKTRAGPRLQRGLVGSGKMFKGEFKHENKRDAENAAKQLEEYLNTYEFSKKHRRKRWSGII